MVPKPFNLRNPNQEGGNRKHLHSEIREMTSALTHHLNDLHHMGGKSSSSSSVHHDETEEDQGVRIITLAGNNTGATMQGELDDASDDKDDKEFTTYTNSNFQAINNSIMFGGSFTCKDPGVHIETCVDYDDDEPRDHREVRRGRKGKKKAVGTSRSDQHSDGSSDENSD